MRCALRVVWVGVAAVVLFGGVSRALPGGAIDAVAVSERSSISNHGFGTPSGEPAVANAPVERRAQVGRGNRFPVLRPLGVALGVAVGVLAVVGLFAGWRIGLAAAIATRSRLTQLPKSSRAPPPLRLCLH